MSYPVDGNIEWLVENAFVDVIKNNFAIKNIFNKDSVNVRICKDGSVDRGLPAVSIEGNAQQAIPNTNEYRCSLRIICETDAYKTDTTGEQIKALVGGIRDILHADDIIDQINDASRGVVMNSLDSLHEVSTDDDSILEGQNQIRRMIIQADAWVYAGSAE
jgi:hypothetical protein